jgi:hypothetical protein
VLGGFTKIFFEMFLITRQYVPEDSELHTRCREILKSHKILKIGQVPHGRFSPTFFPKGKKVGS